MGLFKDLSANGPATSVELATRTGINERYAREWLGAMTTAGYLKYDAVSQQFTLPAEHAQPLAQEGGPVFFGGVYQMMTGVCRRARPAHRCLPMRAVACRSLPTIENMWDGLERFTNGWFENLLIQQWIPAMPDRAGEAGARCQVADVGCGRGRALVKLAQTFPQARYVGYDIFGPTIERATANAQAAGVGDRVRFAQRDVSQGIPEQYDVITTFDVVHDAVDPVGLLRTIRQSLRADGVYVCLDINCSDKLQENQGPLGAMFHGFSVLYCMTTSLAGGGVGLGTLGFHEPKVRELCAEAGFSSVRRVPLENPFNNLYEIRP